ncbi:MAG: hypothetical protein ACKVP0_26100 [Pirellulaceae bacterium]
MRLPWNANKEVENALITFQKSQERAERLNSAVVATKRSVELAVIQYRAGTTDYERIFNLQNILVRQELDLAAARAEISLSLIEVYRSLRGGWQVRLDTPLVEGEVLPAVEGVLKPPVPEPVPPVVE